MANHSESPAAVAPPEPAPAAAGAQALEAEIDQMVDAARRASEPPPSPALEGEIDRAITAAQQTLAEVVSPAEAVRRLDEALSATAEQRMNQPPPTPAAPPPEAATNQTAPAPPLEQIISESSVAMSPASETPTTDPGDSDAATAESADPVEASPGDADQPVGCPVDHPRKAAAEPDRQTSAMTAFGRVLSLPMTRLSPVSRDLIGWFALVTLFNAVCLWVYLLILV